MIGKPIKWNIVSEKRGFDDMSSCLKYYRKDGHSYEKISHLLGVSKTTIWNKAMELLEEKKLTKEELIRRAR